VISINDSQKVLGSSFLGGDPDPPFYEYADLIKKDPSELQGMLKEANDKLLSKTGQLITSYQNEHPEYAHLSYPYLRAKIEPELRKTNEYINLETVQIATKSLMTPNVLDRLQRKSFQGKTSKVVGAVTNPGKEEMDYYSPEEIAREKQRAGMNREIGSLKAPLIDKTDLFLTGHGLSGGSYEGNLPDLSNYNVNAKDDANFPQVYKYLAENNPQADTIIGAHCSGGGMCPSEVVEPLSAISVQTGKAIIIPGGFATWGTESRPDVYGSGAKNRYMDYNNPLGHIVATSEDENASATLFTPGGVRIFKFNSHSIPYMKALEIIKSSPEYQQFKKSKKKP